jgi:hypothetical protein
MPIDNRDMIPGGDEGKRLAAPIHIDCMIQEILDENGGGMTVEEALKIPHIKEAYGRMMMAALRAKS